MSWDKVRVITWTMKNVAISLGIITCPNRRGLGKRYLYISCDIELVLIDVIIILFCRIVTPSLFTAANTIPSTSTSSTTMSSTTRTDATTTITASSTTSTDID